MACGRVNWACPEAALNWAVPHDWRCSTQRLIRSPADRPAILTRESPQTQRFHTARVKVRNPDNVAVQRRRRDKWNSFTVLGVL